MSKTVLDAQAVADAIGAMAQALCAASQDAPWAVIGIRRGGEPLAQRLAARMGDLSGTAPPLGAVDITLYRDDGFGPNDWPEVGVTELPFDLKDYTLVLVDDVLYTGRTVRAALDAILDYGRPRAVRLAVLVDRGLRELPIRADAVGQLLDTRPDEHVQVQLAPSRAESDRVVVAPQKERSV